MLDLSICVITYNHEKYISKALDSILMQKTNYSFEVLIADDCSTDNTPNILKEYEERYPAFFQIIYRKKNMNKSNALITNGQELRRRAKGKYVINLEGDDYWINPNKINKQIKFLNENCEYIAVGHDCYVVNGQSNITNEKYPTSKTKEYTLSNFISDQMPGQLATIMYRNPLYINSDHSILEKKMIVGDQVLVFWLALNGKIYVDNAKDSCYRHVTSGGSSFSATSTYSYEEWRRLYLELLNFSKKYNHIDGVKYARVALAKNLYRAIKLKKFSFHCFIEYLKDIKCSVFAIFDYIHYLCNKNILKKDLWL